MTIDARVIYGKKKKNWGGWERKDDIVVAGQPAGHIFTRKGSKRHEVYTVDSDGNAVSGYNLDFIVKKSPHAALYKSLPTFQGMLTSIQSKIKVPKNGPEAKAQKSPEGTQPKQPKSGLQPPNPNNQVRDKMVQEGPMDSDRSRVFRAKTRLEGRTPKIMPYKDLVSKKSTSQAPSAPQAPTKLATPLRKSDIKAVYDLKKSSPTSQQANVPKENGPGYITPPHPVKPRAPRQPWPYDSFDDAPKSGQVFKFEPHRKKDLYDLHKLDSYQVSKPRKGFRDTLAHKERRFTLRHFLQNVQQRLKPGQTTALHQTTNFTAF